MSRVVDVVLRVLGVCALALVLAATYLAVGLLLDATNAEGATPIDSGVRPVVITPDPEPVPASLLRRY